MTCDKDNYYLLPEKIKTWAKELGFQQVGFSDIDLSEFEQPFKDWLAKGFHGEMAFMAAHGNKRTRPAELLPGTLSIVSARMDYLPEDALFADTLEDPQRAYISRYALGRDYHKVVRNKLKQLGKKIEAELGLDDLSFRPFVDSAPVLERAIAQKAGLGWTGKHSLILNEKAGSWFFLGELFLPFELPSEQEQHDQCGSCVACITTCPTQAIVEPYVVDSNKCISYLTIEYKGVIPEQYRKAMGNRIYGCDDCQLICPWNRYAELTQEPDFTPRNKLNTATLLTLWQWTEQQFLDNTQGSPIRRIGYPFWLRNIVIALGNAPFSLAIIEAIEDKYAVLDALVQEHADWALAQQQLKASITDKPNRKLGRLIKAINIGLPRDA